jgi:hypothetical protein
MCAVIKWRYSIACMIIAAELTVAPAGMWKICAK